MRKNVRSSLEQQLADRPRDVRLILALAEFFAREGAGPAAAQHLVRAADIIIEDEQSGGYLKAVALLRHALKLGGPAPHLSLRLATYYLNFGLLAEALDACNSATDGFQATADSTGLREIEVVRARVLEASKANGS